MTAKRNIIIIILVFSFVILARLFYIQILDDSYEQTAVNNALRHQVEHPARGLLFDRNGQSIAENIPSYDIMLSPREMKQFDTLELCNIFNLSIEDLNGILKRVDKNYNSFLFLKQITEESYAKYRERAYLFPGFYPVIRTLRTYPKSVGGNVLGYIQEVDNIILGKDSYYSSGDYIGRSGIEESYEKELRGDKGISVFLRDSRNRLMGSYMNGKYDTIANPGKDLTLSLDADLQEYAQLLMTNKKGSAVAIDPSTGEILALVSAPNFDPDLMAGPERRQNYTVLQTDPGRPLFNRAIMSSTNPPGSVFKVVNGLIGLQEEVLTSDTRYSCNGRYPYGRGVGCHAHSSPTNLVQSVQMSCNSYYCYVFRSIIDNKKFSGIDSSLMSWRRYVTNFGFGKKLGVDLPSEQAGVLPSVSLYDKIHGKGYWKSLSIISLAIGQGEIGATTLQLANLGAIIANRGYYYIPHMVKKIGADSVDAKYYEKQYVGISEKNFLPIIEGMDLAVNGIPGSGSTAWRVKIPGIDMCGKTGTAQNPHGADNAVFLCFAPKDNPKIAIAVYVENVGFGGTHAAPIAALMVEKYLNKEITLKDLEIRMLSY